MQGPRTKASSPPQSRARAETRAEMARLLWLRTVGDRTEVAEEVLAAVVGLDEAEAACAPRSVREDRQEVRRGS